MLGFSAREVAESLETTVASVNSALQRARKTVDERLPERSQQATLRSLGDERIRELVEAYVDAWARGDVEVLRAPGGGRRLLDATVGDWWRGRETIAGFAKTAVEVCGGRAPFRPAPTGSWPSRTTTERETGRYAASAIDVLTFEGALIKEITAFVPPELFPRFGLACRARGLAATSLGSVESLVHEPVRELVVLAADGSVRHLADAAREHAPPHRGASAAPRS